MTRYRLFCIITVFILFSGCVDMQTFTVLENKVAALEIEQKRQLRVMATKVHEMDKDLKNVMEKMDNTGGSREQYAEIRHDINVIKERNQELGGIIEEINYSLQAHSGKGSKSPEQRIVKLEDTVYQNYLKLLKIQKYLGMEVSGRPAPALKPGQDKAGSKTAGENKESKALKQEKSLYSLAKKMFDNGNKTKARTLFQNFLKKYPHSKLAGNARFWVAESFYAEKLYERAILEYQKVLEHYPQNNKIPGARLKQGYSFAALGENANARFILNELIKTHPDSDEAKLAKRKLKSLE